MCFKGPHTQIQLTRLICLRIKGDAVKLEYQAYTKYFELFVDEHFLGSEHIDHVRKRLRVVAAYLYNMRSIDFYLKENGYCELGESVLRYVIAVYGTPSRSKTEVIEQNPSTKNSVQSSCL